jgi:hypothetical protein
VLDDHGVGKVTRLVEADMRSFESECERELAEELVGRRQLVG